MGSASAAAELVVAVSICPALCCRSVSPHGIVLGAMAAGATRGLDALLPGVVAAIGNAAVAPASDCAKSLLIERRRIGARRAGARRLHVGRQCGGCGDKPNQGKTHVDLLVFLPLPEQ